MIPRTHATRAPWLAATLAVFLMADGRSQAGDRFWRRRAVATPTVACQPVSQVPPGPLGTFAPTPMLRVRSDAPTGSGYAPLGMSGDTTLSIYGPISPFRAIAAPVQTYARGYDGNVYMIPGTATSTPNRPEISPVVYPTQSTNYFGPRVLKSPPWEANGSSWIDQN